MPKPIPVEIQVAAVNAYHRGYGSYDRIATLFGVGRATLNRWLRRYREHGTLEPDPHAGGQEAKIGPQDVKALRSMIESHPDWTLDEMTYFWKKTYNSDISRSSMVRAVFRHGFSHKKKAYEHRSSTAQTW